MKKPIFRSYDSLDPNILNEVMVACLRISDSEWVEIIRNDMVSYFAKVNLDPPDGIWRISLAGVEESLVVAVVDFQKTEFGANGVARLPRINDSRLPYVLLQSKENLETLGHECIHVQQFLNPEHPGISIDNRNLMFDHDTDRASELRAKSDGEAAGLQCLVEMLCYMSWTELEAHHFTPGREDLPIDLIDRVVAGVAPFTIIEKYTLLLRDFSVQEDMLRQLSDYCDEMTKQVPWVAELVDSFEPRSLFDAIRRSNEKQDPDVAEDDAPDWSEEEDSS